MTYVVKLGGMVLAATLAGMATMRAPSAPSPSLGEECTPCVNTHMFMTVTTCGCMVEILNETYSSGICTGAPPSCAGPGCEASVTYQLSGAGQGCTGSKTVGCSTSCGGHCDASARCGSLSMQCGECGAG